MTELDLINEVGAPFAGQIARMVHRKKGVFPALLRHQFGMLKIDLIGTATVIVITVDAEQPRARTGAIRNLCADIHGGSPVQVLALARSTL